MELLEEILEDLCIKKNLQVKWSSFPMTIRFEGRPTFRPIHFGPTCFRPDLNFSCAFPLGRLQTGFLFDAESVGCVQLQFFFGKFRRSASLRVSNSVS